jgi:hypothetical protein
MFLTGKIFWAKRKISEWSDGLSIRSVKGVLLAVLDSPLWWGKFPGKRNDQPGRDFPGRNRENDIGYSSHFVDSFHLLPESPTCGTVQKHERGSPGVKFFSQTAEPVRSGWLLIGLFLSLDGRIGCWINWSNMFGKWRTKWGVVWTGSVLLSSKDDFQ